MKDRGLNKRLRDTPGRKKATDEELLKAYKEGMFLHQIQKKYICSLRRLHRIVREWEEDKAAGAEATANG